jgi:RHS repeat-associated protein
VTKYYYAGGQRIALRSNGVVSYLLDDHLGSTSLTMDAAGLISSEQRCTAWGDVRFSSGSAGTKYTYTGQYSNVADFGLLFYNARWYDNSLGRFAQADSVVPGGVQGLDRYAGMGNNPLRYNDPSGHSPVCVMGGSNGCLQWAGLTGVNAAAGFEKSKGFDNDFQANVAIKMTNLGIYGNKQAAMEYVVNTEFNSGIIDTSMVEKSQSNYLFQGMANRYQEFCKGGAWTGSCLTGFWAYHQGPLTGAPATDYGAERNAKISNIASAILHPGQVFGDVVTNTGWNGCPTGSANICHYALPTSDLEGWIRTTALPYPNANMPAGWSYQPAETPNEILYAWNNIDSLFVVMSQAMWEDFNINHPTYLWGH